MVEITDSEVCEIRQKNITESSVAEPVEEVKKEQIQELTPTKQASNQNNSYKLDGLGDLNDMPSVDS